MRNLIVDLLSFSQIDDVPNTFESINISNILDEVKGNLSIEIQKYQAVINIQENLPQILGKEHLILRVFENLISNGIKYQKPEVSPEIDITYLELEDKHKFCVQDNGIGIDDQHKDLVFEMFHRLLLREKYSGTGIGLAIVNKIIQKHKGAIWFESDGKSGTKFIFTIPKLLVTK